MPLATKHFDLVLGVDVHIVVLVTPGGPVPTPTPAVFTGIVFAPRDYLPRVGVTVQVNGLPRATAGSGVVALPGHVPIGGPFLRAPANKGELFMGSLSVASGDEPFGYGLLPVLTCQDIGVPPPPRATRKKFASTALLLPTSIVIPIPHARNVLVGGFPGISLSTMLDHAEAPGKEVLMAPLKQLKPVKYVKNKLRRGARYMKLHADGVLKKLGLRRLTLLRNEVRRGICFLTGHPVDIATGKLLTELTDLTLPGPLPFPLERVWFSTSTYDGPLGHGWHASFDAALAQDPELVGVRLSDGRAALFPPLRPGEVYFDAGERLTLARDANGYGLREADTGLTRHFAPVAGRGDLPMVALEDRHGHRLAFAHDHLGRLACIVDSGGRSWRLLHQGQTQRITAIEGPHPSERSRSLAHVRFGYDASGDLVEARNALGHAQRFVYRDHLLVQETRASGLSFHFAWEGAGASARCVRTWGDGGIHDHKLTYDGERLVTVVEDSLGFTTSHVHDGAMVTRSTDALGHVRSTEYDDGYRPLLEIDALGQQTRYAYDGRGNRTLSLHPDGAAVRVTYGEHDLPIEAVDALGGCWIWTRDARGRVLSRTDPLQRTTRYLYEGPWLVGCDDPEGGRTQFEYDREGNLAAVTAPSGARTRYTYDRLGRWTSIVDASGSVRRRELDLLGRPLQIFEPDGNVRRLTHDAEGNIVRAQDARRDVRFDYTGMGRLAARHEAGSSIQFHYDREERLIRIVNEHGAVHRLVRGLGGFIDVEHGFDDVTRRYVRDAAGRVLRVEEPSGASEYAYDPAGRVTSVRHPDGTCARYAYRRDGALCEASNDTASVYFEHDAMGRLVREARGGHWVQSAYDARDGRVEVRSSAGLALTVVRDLAGDAVYVHEAQSGLEARIVRDARGLELGRSLPGGLHSRLERDDAGRPTQQLVTREQTTLRATGYAWDVDTRLRVATDALLGASVYRHDARARLAGVRHPDGTTTLRIPDAVGNLFGHPAHADRTFGAAGQLQRAEGPGGETHRAYDATGRLIRKTGPTGATWRYAWTGSGMLERVVRPDGSEVRFAYDALGRRIRKSYRGQTTHWVWDGDVPLHEWVEGSLALLGDAGGVSWARAHPEARSHEAELEALLASPPQARGSERAPITWVFSPDTHAPLARLLGSGSLGIVCDFLGTPILMGQHDRPWAWSAAIGIDGDVRMFAGERWTCPWRWPGQYADAETGLHYNRFRYYDPESESYVSQDPIGLWGGLRPYGYVHDPLTWVDPLGLRECISPTAARAVTRPLAPALAAHRAGFAPSPLGHGPATRQHEFARADGDRAVVQAHSAAHVTGEPLAPRHPHAPEVALAPRAGKLIEVD